MLRTRAVSERTTVLLLRLRFHLVTRGRDGKNRPLLAEDLALVGFQGRPEDARWLELEEVEPLLEAEADANIAPDQAQAFLAEVLDAADALAPHLAEVAHARGDALFEAHKRVRKATKVGVRALEVDVHTPPDVLGVYLYLPVPKGPAAR